MIPHDDLYSSGIEVPPARAGSQYIYAHGPPRDGPHDPTLLPGELMEAPAHARPDLAVQGFPSILGDEHHTVLAFPAQVRQALPPFCHTVLLRICQQAIRGGFYSRSAQSSSRRTNRTCAFTGQTCAECEKWSKRARRWDARRQFQWSYGSRSRRTCKRCCGRYSIVTKRGSRSWKPKWQNPQNSSKPPSSDGPHVKRKSPRPSPGRKRGGQPGYRAHHRTLVPVEKVDEVMVCTPTHCRRCSQACNRTARAHEIVVAAV
jgi:hypothetical protein